MSHEKRFHRAAHSTRELLAGIQSRVDRVRHERTLSHEQGHQPEYEPQRDVRLDEIRECLDIRVIYESETLRLERVREGLEQARVDGITNSDGTPFT